MEYMSAPQAAEKWGISERRVQILCSQNRIPGVSKLGYMWLIPKDAEKPIDGRTKQPANKKSRLKYGTKRTILYYTKAITILAVSLITYLIFVAAFFVIEIIQSGYIPSASEALTLFGWALACGIVLLAFESISIFLCVIIQNIGVVTGICCLYVFSGASVYLMLWSNMDAASIPLKIFVYGNPMYYWMNFCSCRTMGIIEHLPFYFMGGILLLIVGGIAMSKKEIK